jgi:Protein of unknown function (DUF4089)
MTQTPNDHAAYVEQMARQLGIVLPPDELAKVAGYFANLARAASQLKEAESSELDEFTIAAGVYRATDGGAQ